MKQAEYQKIEAYMLACMADSAHDREHVYRVLYTALQIAACEEQADRDVLIAACLLHDIGRKEQLEDPTRCHARVGAVKAHRFLTENGFSVEFADRVAGCIRVHRFRSSDPPRTLEEKILFDADKLDATGAVGIARTLIYKGQVNEPLYTLDEAGLVADGTGDVRPSFFREYKFKLEGLYSKFYTAKAQELALQRQRAAVSFYESIYKEAQDVYRQGQALLAAELTEGKTDANRPKEIETERLLLRPVTQADAAAVWDIWKCPENERYMSDPVGSLEETAAICKQYEKTAGAKEGQLRVAVMKKSGEVVGTCCFGPRSKGPGWGLGYSIGSQYWGQGFATELLQGILDYGAACGVRDFASSCAHQNRASARVMEKCGMRFDHKSTFTQPLLGVTYEEDCYCLHLEKGKKDDGTTGL